MSASLKPWRHQMPATAIITRSAHMYWHGAMESWPYALFRSWWRIETINICEYCIVTASIEERDEQSCSRLQSLKIVLTVNNILSLIKHAIKHEQDQMNEMRKKSVVCSAKDSHKKVNSVFDNLHTASSWQSFLINICEKTV